MIRDLVDDGLAKLTFRDETRDRVADVLTQMIEAAGKAALRSARQAPNVPAPPPTAIPTPGPVSAESARTEPDLPEPDLSEAGMSEPDVSETGLSETGLSETGLSETGLSERGPAQPAANQLAGRAQARAPRRPPAPPVKAG